MGELVDVAVGNDSPAHRRGSMDAPCAYFLSPRRQRATQFSVLNTLGRYPQDAGDHSGAGGVVGSDCKAAAQEHAGTRIPAGGTC